MDTERVVPGNAVDVDFINLRSERFSDNRANRVARNAVASMGIANAAKNTSASRRYHETFGVSLPTPATVTDQQRSGRCWMFSTLNTLRPRLLEVFDIDDFEFSTAYLTFFEKLEKSNSFLERVIATADRPADDRVVNHITLHHATDGGQFMFCASLLEKWGAVPKYAMPETACSVETKFMVEALGDLLVRDAAILRAAFAAGASHEELESQKQQMLGEVHQLLCCCLGEPPVTFDLDIVVGPNAKVDAGTVSEPNARGERILRDHGITPQQFVERYVHFAAADYVELVSMPGATRPFGHLFGINWFDMVVGGTPLRLLNMEMPVLEQATVASLKGGVPVYMMCDVGKRSLRYAVGDQGLLAPEAEDLESLFGLDFSIDRADSIDLNGTGLSHCMVFQGVELDDAGEPVAWRVENSHGPAENFGGYYLISRDWWRSYGGDVVVARRFVPDDVLELWDTLPVEWRDPWQGFINYRAW